MVAHNNLGNTDYVMVRPIKRGRVTVGYVMKDSFGNVKNFNNSDIREFLIHGGHIRGIKLTSDNRVIVDKLSYGKLLNSTTQNISVITGQNLIDLCTSRVSRYISRGYVKNIVEFANNDRYDRLFIVHGIRRTGKTVLFMHSILNIHSSGVKDDKLYYININNSKATFKELVSVLSNIRDSIVFIDEITFIPEIISEINYLVDIVSGSNRIKIIIAGTDSYVFNLANQTSLFGRAYYTHSTLISYREYSRVTGLGLDSYISDGTLFGGLYADKSVVDNINGMVIGNIVNTLNKNRSFISGHAIYSNIANLNSGTLGAIIYYILITTCDTKFRRNINSIANRPLGKIKISFLAKAINVDVKNIPKFISGISNNSFNTMIAILEQLDLIRQVENLANLLSDNSDKIEQVTDLEICTTQPGLIWSLLTMFNTQYNIKIGKATENLVLLSLYSMQSIKDYHILNIGYLKYRADNKDHEIDIALRINNDKTFESFNVFIEVKSDTNKSSDYIKHLADNSLKIFNPHIKIVIYMGETDISGHIKWVNLIEFITNPWLYIKK